MGSPRSRNRLRTLNFRKSSSCDHSRFGLEGASAIPDSCRMLGRTAGVALALKRRDRAAWVAVHVLFHCGFEIGHRPMKSNPPHPPSAYDPASVHPGTTPLELNVAVTVPDPAGVATVHRLVHQILAPAFSSSSNRASNMQTTTRAATTYIMSVISNRRGKSQVGARRQEIHALGLCVSNAGQSGSAQVEMGE